MKATVLEDYDFAHPPESKGSSKYDRFFDGRIHRIDIGERPTDSARTYLYKAAAKRGLKIRVSAPEPGVLVVQAYKPDAS